MEDDDFGIGQINIRGDKQYSNLQIGGNSRVHAGDTYNFRTALLQERQTGAKVLEAFGSYANRLLVVNFASKVIDTTKALVRDSSGGLSKVLRYAEVDLSKLEQDYEWLTELLSYSESSTGLLDDEDLLEQSLLCEKAAHSLLGELTKIWGEAEQDAVAEDGTSAANDDQQKRHLNHPDPGSWMKRARRSLARERDRAKKTGQMSAWDSLNRQAYRVKILTGQLANNLLVTFWSQQARVVENEKALVDRRRSIELANELAYLLSELHEERIKAILEDLSFSDMDERRHAIIEAYPSTYYWALDDTELGLRTWLVEGQGIYWISGKAGSGKSTLMKFLTSEKKTRELLKIWGCGCDTVVLGFYFWFAGSTLQKSISGLLRSILHQIISARPALSIVAFKNRFNRSVDLKKGHWSEKELFCAIQAIAEHKIDTNGKKFCIFVDGLDEYSGNHIELVKLLACLGYNPDIKLCLASRPWNAFRQAYEQTVPNLRLEDLTQPDILHYVRENIYSSSPSYSSSRNYTPSMFEDWAHRQGLMADPGRFLSRRENPEIEVLIKLIAQRAEGVFLWVYLVMKAVLEGLAEGDSIAYLQRRVQRFPENLNDFFRAILQRVDGLYHDQTYQFLKLALLYMEDEEAESVSCWLDFWLISQDDTGFQPQTVYDLLEKGREQQKMLDDLQKSLSSSCKDLLLLPRGTEPTNCKVTWLHRTVYDFLLSEGMPSTIDRQVPEIFKDGTVLQFMWLARWEARHWYKTWTDPQSHLEKVISVAFSRKHNLWSDAFAGAYDRHLHQFYCYQDRLDYGGSFYPGFCKDELQTQAIANLVAFGHTTYVKYVLNRLKQENLSATLPYGFALKSILQATIGDNPIRQFDICMIDEDLMKALNLFSGVMGHEMAAPGDCNFTFWRIFWHKWALQAPLLTQEDLLKAWPIAKFLIAKSKSSRHELICTSSSGNRSAQHIHLKAIDILKKTVPRSWLDEIQGGKSVPVVVDNMPSRNTISVPSRVVRSDIHYGNPGHTPAWDLLSRFVDRNVAAASKTTTIRDMRYHQGSVD